MTANDIALVKGMRDTRCALARWNREPGKLLGPWLGLSVLVAGALLFAVYAVARLSTPDATPILLPGYHRPATAEDYVVVLYRNSLVLALHAFACVAGFIAGSSLPVSAARRAGLSRRVHELAGPLAIAFVGCATAFSLATQAYAIGGAASSLAWQLGVSPGVLLLGLLPHALPELVALFLPLAAWLIASRRGRWDELLAATLVTVTGAVPVLLASAAVELWVSPRLLSALAG